MQKWAKQTSESTCREAEAAQLAWAELLYLMRAHQQVPGQDRGHSEYMPESLQWVLSDDHTADSGVERPGTLLCAEALRLPGVGLLCSHPCAWTPELTSGEAPCVFSFPTCSTCLGTWEGLTVTAHAVTRVLCKGRNMLSVIFVVVATLQTRRFYLNELLQIKGRAHEGC